VPRALGTDSESPLVVAASTYDSEAWAVQPEKLQLIELTVIKGQRREGRHGREDAAT
jgi:hypothetical protein